MAEFVAGIAAAVAAYASWQAWRTRGERLDAIIADVAKLQSQAQAIRSCVEQATRHDQEIGALCLRAGLKREPSQR